jgi:hypothetical protein
MMIDSYLGLEIHLVISLSLFFFFSILVKRNLAFFIPLIFLINIFGNGPQVYGYFFYDEFLSIGMSLVYLYFKINFIGFSSLIKRIKNIPKKYIFFILIFPLFMASQSLRGIIVVDDIRIFRFVIFFLGLLPIYFSIYLALDDINKNNKIFNFIILASFIYLFLYFLIGIFYDYYFISQFSSQNYFWSGTSYAFYSILITLIANYKLLEKSSNIKKKFIGYSLFTLLIYMGMYFDSRMVQVSTLVFVFSFLLSKQVKTLLILFITYTIVVTAFITYQNSWIQVSKVSTNDQGQTIVTTSQGNGQSDLIEVQIESNQASTEIIDKKLVLEHLYTINAIKTYFKHNLVGSFAIFQGNDSDFTRLLQFKSTLDLLNDSGPFNQLFGYGIYSHRLKLVDYVNYYFSKNFLKIAEYEKANKLSDSRSDLKNEIKIYRTNSLNALIIDTGIIGLILTIALFFISIMSIIRSTFVYKYHTSLFLIISFFWMLFSNITDIYLFYILLFPGLFNVLWDKDKSN